MFKITENIEKISKIPLINLLFNDIITLVKLSQDNENVKGIKK